ncbi:MAG: hypothetical protein CME62_18030 [Halobacteriovoraceae bacterium]|nr:hypothetical protein [Halobacteriovoraceae bacterium]|tara:strand:- start:6678 stop:6857 length:180 start_codon:yes stop_codon:yes gene_type:complete
MENSLKHDFINNCLRLEVLHNLMCESVNQNHQIKEELLLDCEKYLNLQLEFIHKMKSKD